MLPSPDMDSKDHRQAMVFLKYLGLSKSVAARFLYIVRRMPTEGCRLLLNVRLAERRR